MGQAASRQESFWEACGFGHKDRVEKFLEEGDIDVNWVSYTHDCCPIHVASQGKPEIVRMLLDKGANVNVKDVRGNLPIHHAAMKGHTDVVEILLEAGSEVDTQDKNGWTALHCASYWNKPGVVKCLLKNGADVNIQNKDQRTALHETARSQEKGDFQLGEIAQWLIEAGSNVNAKSSDLGEADFTGLMFASYHNHPEVANAFITAGCEINAFGTNRWTALHWACDRGNDEMVFLLLEAGIDPTIRGWRNELASDRCTDNEMKEVVMNAVHMFQELSFLDSKVSSGEKDTKVNINVETAETSRNSNYVVDSMSDAKKESGSSEKSVVLEDSVTTQKKNSVEDPTVVDSFTEEENKVKDDQQTNVNQTEICEEIQPGDSLTDRQSKETAGELS